MFERTAIYSSGARKEDALTTMCYNYNYNKNYVIP